MAVGYNNIDVAGLHRARRARQQCARRADRDDRRPRLRADDGGGAAHQRERARSCAAANGRKLGVDMFAGSDVHGATLGILGMGRIGQAIARRGALGFSMPVIYHNRSRLDAARRGRARRALRLASDALLRESDHLVIVVPYSAGVASPDRRRRAGADEADRDARPTSRAAASSTTPRSPRRCATSASPPPASTCSRASRRSIPACSTLPNVVLTPHIGSASLPTRRAMANLAADNLIATLGSGRPAAGAADCAQSRGPGRSSAS